jgi:hypothetical protein
MTPFTRGMSYTDVGTAGYCMDSTNDDLITDYDGTHSFTYYDADHPDDPDNGAWTMLFAHRSSAVTAWDHGYVRALGMWSHYNMPYDSETATGFPTPGTDEAKGNLIWMAGRNYGFNHTNSAHNFEYIGANMCGEQ